MSVQEAGAAPAIRWVRAIVAGVLAEVALIAVAVPLYYLPSRQTALDLGIPPASFLVLVGFGWWAAKGAPRSKVLNGFVAGSVGVVLYVVLTAIGSVLTHQDFAPSLRPAYLLAHALKMAGGAVGGWLAARRR